MNNLKEAAEIIINDCMSVKDDETTLVIVDKPLRKIGQAIFAAAKEAANEAVLTEIAPRANHGAEPPASIANLMQEFDVVIMPTSKSLSHTKARKAANDAGARAATLPDITEEIMIRTLTADYEAIKERSEKVAEILDEGKKAHLITEAGTDLKMSLVERSGHPDTGIYHQAGNFGNLPAGEAYIAPLEETAEGKVVIDGAMSGLGVLEEPVTLIVEDGYVVDIQGGKEAAELTELVDQYGKEARNIAELGIGTNDQAILTGNVLEDEKVMSTVHVAIGDNSAFGGKIEIESHLDGIINQPTLKVDDRVIMKEGEFKIL
ncbi:aminopeptidase [Acetohalobium arabaticum]|uniref:Leucyl aminopeptidase (Aminopeptidase T) n=1 Tax=Acetohalobium arabaticum (strain ATCC 49924 / DSM 5501 / Z-7288) TaxID=574087 RepID=D9QVF9_ACEAZ|nr:aminopeptidase [Acetohalobium arabaticum]ADL12218.1 leucyl aminopeptidase (aminopeptidase T) [Acetohalobium arabaticum DSM 5501]